MDIVQYRVCGLLHGKISCTYLYKEHNFDCVGSLLLCIMFQFISQYYDMYVTIYVSCYTKQHPVTMGWHLKPLPTPEHNEQTRMLSVLSFVEHNVVVPLLIFFNTNLVFTVSV